MSPPSRVISPLRVSPNGRCFTDARGNPSFWLGDTQWELFRLFDPETARSILRKRQSQGFNVILVMLTGVEAGHVDARMATPYVNLEGETPWLEGNPDRPNERYFRHVDAIIRMGEQTGQTLVVGVYHQWHVNIITPARARRWARWIGHRYRDVPNLIWSMYPQASPAYAPVCRELAAGLQEGDGGAHMISVHPDPAVASSSFLHEEPWLAFNMIQTCIHYESIVEAVAADYHRAPVKPVVMAEGGYEGVEFDRLQTALEIRKQAYWSQLAGGHHIYGHNDCWVKPLAWNTWIGAPGAESLRVFREAITSCPGWWELLPDQSLFAAGAGEGPALNVAARSPDGGRILAYISEPSRVDMRAGGLSHPTPSATWIDPVSGARHPAGAVAAGEVLHFETPSGWRDALLLIECC